MDKSVVYPLIDSNSVENGSNSRILHSPLKLVSLAMILLALPWVSSMVFSSLPHDSGNKALPPWVILRHLVDDGLIKKGQHGVVLGDNSIADNNLGFLRDVGIDILIGDEKKAIVNQGFDLTLATCFHSVQQIDSIIKNSGIVVLPLDSDSDHIFVHSLLNRFKIVYLRQFRGRW